MPALKTEVLSREFYYNGVRLPDPSPDMTVDQVRDLLTPRFPEIATAAVQGPEDMGTYNLPAGNTTWRLSNAISWIAGKTEDTERKLELMKLAGEVLPAKTMHHRTA